MKRKRIVTLSRDEENRVFDTYYCIHRPKRRLYICSKDFEQITGFRLKPGQSCRVTVKIERVK